MQGSATRAGLYHRDEFRDNCGFGLVAHVDGKRSHDLLQSAISSLACMTHRGGIAADSVTGDGCGILMQKPDAWLREIAREQFGQELSDDYGIGMVFLSRDEAQAAYAQQVLEEALTDQGLSVVGWRVVPCDDTICGKMALEIGRAHV